MSPADHVTTALVADDESLARRRIQELLRGRDGVRLIGQRATGPATVEAVRELAPDILFLDVQMPGLDGFEVLASLRAEERPVVVFSTAYDEYALAAFEVSAVDYLLKPFADERFEQALRRAREALRGARLAEWQERLGALLEGTAARPRPEDATAPDPGQRLDRLAVRKRERFEMIDAASVDWIEAEGDYASLHVGTACHLVRITMAALESRLDPARFLRIHRSTIVQISRVREVRPDAHGDWVVVLHDGLSLRVSRSFRDATLSRLGVRHG